MNFGRGGQNIVQSGNNNPNIFKGAGGFFGALLNQKLRIQERDYHRTKDEESRIRVNDAKTMSKLKADQIGNVMSTFHMGNVFDFANQRFGKDHPDVVAGGEGAPKATDYIRPELQEMVANNGVEWKGGMILPGTPSKGEKAALAAARVRSSDKIDEDVRQNPNPETNTVARFGENGNIKREPVTLENIEYGEKTSERAPMSMRTEDSVAPTDRTWTPEEKSALESERPRTEHLMDGINDGKGGNK